LHLNKLDPIVSLIYKIIEHGVLGLICRHNHRSSEFTVGSCFFHITYIFSINGKGSLFNMHGLLLIEKNYGAFKYIRYTTQ